MFQGTSHNNIFVHSWLLQVSPLYIEAYLNSQNTKCRRLTDRQTSPYAQTRDWFSPRLKAISWNPHLLASVTTRKIRPCFSSITQNSYCSPVVEDLPWRFLLVWLRQSSSWRDSVLYRWQRWGSVLLLMGKKGELDLTKSTTSKRGKMIKWHDWVFNSCVRLVFPSWCYVSSTQNWDDCPAFLNCRSMLAETCLLIAAESIWYLSDISIQFHHRQQQYVGPKMNLEKSYLGWLLFEWAPTQLKKKLLYPKPVP